MPTVTELPGLTFLSRLFGDTAKLSDTLVIVELPVFVSVTVYEVLSPRSIEEGPLIETEPCGVDGGADAVTVNVAVVLRMLS